jgi:hypothetical protein
MFFGIIVSLGLSPIWRGERFLQMHAKETRVYKKFLREPSIHIDPI